MSCLERQHLEKTNKQTTPQQWKSLLFSPLKISSFHYGAQPTITVESTIFRLLAVWSFNTQINGLVWQTFRRHIISKASPQLQKEAQNYFQLFIFIFFFLTGHLSAILNWDFTEVSSRDIQLATPIHPFWLWVADSNDQSCGINSIKTKTLLMT